MIQKAVILAAGNAKRLFPISLEIPKPLLTLGGHTLIELVANRFERFARVNTIYASVGYQYQKVSQRFIRVMENTNLKYGLFVDEMVPGTSYWLFRYKNHFLKGDLAGEALWVSTVDNGIQIDYNMVAEEFEMLNRPSCMIVPAPRDCIDRSGDLFIYNDDFKILELLKKSKKHLEGFSKHVFMGSGLQLINPAKIINLVGDSAYNNFRELCSYLIEEGEVYVAKTIPSKWCKIDRIEDWTREIVLFTDNKGAYYYY